MVTDMLEFYAASYRRSGLAGAAGGPPVHDPCAVARVARPGLMTVEDAFVAVETRGEWTSGMTVTDFRGVLGRPPNVKVATTLDAGGFWELMLSALEAIGVRSGDGPAGEKAPGKKAPGEKPAAKKAAGKKPGKDRGKGKAGQG
jgi:hypothetical protein